MFGRDGSANGLERTVDHFSHDAPDVFRSGARGHDNMQIAVSEVAEKMVSEVSGKAWLILA